MNEKYRLGSDANKAFLKDLREDLLSFGKHFPSPEGGSYYLSDDGTPWKDRPREAFITARMAHVYCMGQFLGFPEADHLADEALRGLAGELKDTRCGGWYAGRTADGGVLPNKMCYAHAFVILAASSGVLAGRPGAKELLAEALEVYDKRFWNEEEGLSADLWDTDFTVLDDYRGLNANMHSVEAFLAAADVTGDEKYRVRAGRIIDHVLEWAQKNDWRIPEHFSKTWEMNLACTKEHPDDPFKPYGATPGHGLEWSRLITQWALSTYLPGAESAAFRGTPAEPYVQAAQHLFERAVTDGWNADGAPGIVYTTDWDGKPVVHDRMHWVLAEALGASAVLFTVTGKTEYADCYSRFLQYADEKMIDHVNGSWFHQLDRSNAVTDTVWPGKFDLYHAFQSTLYPLLRPDLSIAPAVKERCEKRTL